MNDMVLLSNDFNGAPITSIRWADGPPMFMAKDVGAALGHGDDGRALLSRVADWIESGDLRQGTDYVRLDGTEFVNFRNTVNAITPGVIGLTASTVTLLSEAGVNLACMLSRTKRAQEFRFWVADVVLPGWRRRAGGGAYDPRALSVDDRFRIFERLERCARLLPKADPERRRIVQQAYFILSGGAPPDVAPFSLPEGASKTQLRLAAPAPAATDPMTAFLDDWRAAFGTRPKTPTALLPLAMRHGIVDRSAGFQSMVTTLGRQLRHCDAVRRRVQGSNPVYALAPASPAA